MESFFIQWYIVNFFYYYARIVPDLSNGSWILCSFVLSTSLSEHFLPFWHKRFQVHFVYSLPQPQKQTHLQAAWILVAETRIYKPSFGCYVCSWLVEYYCFWAFCVYRARKAMHIKTRSHIYTNTYLYLFSLSLYLSLFLSYITFKAVSSCQHLQSQSNIILFFLVFSLFIVKPSSLITRKLALVSVNGFFSHNPSVSSHSYS